MTRETTRPAINVDEDSLRTLAAFSERHGLSRADVYGYALEELADQTNGGGDELAQKIADAHGDDDE